MNRDKMLSDEQLNAYIDGQLDLKEQSRLLEIMRDDPELGRRNCALQKAHELVRMTYRSESVPDTTTPSRTPSSRWFMGLAAMLLIGFGALLGWAGFSMNNSNSLIELASTVHANPANASAQPWRVMLHVSSNQPRRLDILLNETEKLLKNSLARQQVVEVEILTNGKGLALVRNNSPHARRLQALQGQYQNLVISACNETLTQLRREGVSVDLLPQTRIVSSALNEALSRQREGWTYIRI